MSILIYIHIHVLISISFYPFIMSDEKEEGREAVLNYTLPKQPVGVKISQYY